MTKYPIKENGRTVAIRSTKGASAKPKQRQKVITRYSDDELLTSLTGKKPEKPTPIPKSAPQPVAKMKGGWNPDYFAESKYTKGSWGFKSPMIPGGIQWGFDSSSTRSESIWRAFLRRNRFMQVAKAGKGPSPYPPDHYIVYKNPDGVLICVTFERRDEEEPRGREGRDASLALGSMRFEAPAEKKEQLNRILKEWRGPRIITRCDANPRFGVADYIKEESPRVANFI